jgi:hypothetical protein
LHVRAENIAAAVAEGHDQARGLGKLPDGANSEGKPIERPSAPCASGSAAMPIRLTVTCIRYHAFELRLLQPHLHYRGHPGKTQRLDGSVQFELPPHCTGICRPIIPGDAR